MKKILFVFVVFLMTASFAMAKEKAPTIKGEVQSIDSAAKTVTIKEKKKEVTVDVTDKTNIMAGKEKKGLSDIKVGDRIVAHVQDKGGKMVADSIHISTGKMASPVKSK